jgi:serine/threonine protein kinase
MEIERYKEIERLFIETVELSNDKRGARIRQLTDNQGLIDSVERLLAEHDRLCSDDFLEVGIFDESIPIRPEEDNHQSIHIDGYAILKTLGRGASGTVYLAKSSPPLDRLVAIKLINSGAGKLTLARFREEQRVLAHLEHAGIARVFDEGVHEDGRPFTVLEYIEGVSITEYCRSHELDWRGATELIVQCCQAVAHAHQRNIIHRDLKPSNLMVTQEDGAARVKVIDFGTAKFADPFLMMTQLTVESQFIGTLPYASPEQLSGGITSDIRTDIHALGIVMYECIVGTHPFLEESSGLKSVIDMIMTKPVPMIQHNANSPSHELSAVLAKACAKEPSERYSSLIHYAEDLEHLLKGLPVRAMRPHPIYLVRKFVRRHMASIATASVFLVTLTVLAAIAINRGLEATKNRDALRETAINLVDDLMPKLADLNGSREARYELAKSLDKRIGDLLLTDSKDQELLLRRAHVLEYQSDMLLSDRRVDESEALRNEAAAIILSLKANGAGDTSVLAEDERRLLIKLGDIAKDRLNYNRALDYYERNHKLLLEAPGDHRESLCWSFERLAWIAGKQGRAQDAMKLAQSRLDLSVELLNENPMSGEFIRNCATAYQIMAELDISRSEFQPALEYAEKSMDLVYMLDELEPDLFSTHTTELNAVFIHARCLFYTGNSDQAIIESDRVLHLAVQLVDLNPVRHDAKKIAWHKLQNIDDLWQVMAPDRDRSALHDLMRFVLPTSDDDT